MVNITFSNTSNYSGTDFLFSPIEYENYNFTDANLPPEEISYDFDFDFSAVVFYVLKGNNFNSIWCDPKASLTNGRFYISSEKDLTIINVNNNQVRIEDYFSKTILGSTNETLEKEDIADITISDDTANYIENDWISQTVRTTSSGGVRVSNNKVRSLK